MNLQLSGEFSGVENEPKVWDNLLNDYLWICRYVRSPSLQWHAMTCEISLRLVKLVERYEEPQYFGGYSNLGGQELNNIERHGRGKTGILPLVLYTHHYFPDTSKSSGIILGCRFWRWQPNVQVDINIPSQFSLWMWLRKNFRVPWN